MSKTDGQRRVELAVTNVVETLNDLVSEIEGASITQEHLDKVFTFVRNYVIGAEARAAMTLTSPATFDFDEDYTPAAQKLPFKPMKPIGARAPEIKPASQPAPSGIRLSEGVEIVEQQDGLILVQKEGKETLRVMGTLPPEKPARVDPTLSEFSFIE